MDDPAWQFLLDSESRYEFVQRVGEGAYGEVVAAKDRLTNELVAIKMVRREGRLNLEKLRREIRNHRYLDHHHVVKFKRLISSSTHFGMVMEYANKGNLSTYIKRRGGLTDKLARFFFQQLVLAVDYCHKMNVVNRDIKLENTLITGENTDWPMLKICDFGFSKNLKLDSVEKSIVGTIELLPPEVICLKPGDTYDGRKADVWCIGIFLYKMVSSKYPFTRNGEIFNTPEIAQRIIGRICALDYQLPDTLPADCADLIKGILVLDPYQRPTVEEIQRHPYFLKDLPPGAVQMNQKLKRQQIVQSDEEIDAILSFANNSAC
eukprot:g3588.t1